MLGDNSGGSDRNYGSRLRQARRRSNPVFSIMPAQLHPSSGCWGVNLKSTPVIPSQSYAFANPQLLFLGRVKCFFSLLV